MTWSLPASRLVSHSIDAPGVYSSAVPANRGGRLAPHGGAAEAAARCARQRVRRLERRGRPGNDPESDDERRRRLDINAILQRLPHRYPFLLVDRVLECVPGKSIRALKNVTYNEPFFPGHFPQPAGDARRHDHRGAGAGRRHTAHFVTADVIPNEHTRFYFVGIDKARFRSRSSPAIS